MPSNSFAHICMLVKDLDQAIEDWTKILRVLDPDQLEEPIVRYEQFEAGGDTMRWATFVSHNGPEIQLMEPGPETPLGQRLAKRGEHVHHICFTTPDVPRTMALLKECKGLSGLNIYGTQVSDDGVAHLNECKNLTRLYLQKTKATARGVADLSKALPQCKIEWDGGVIEPKK